MYQIRLIRLNTYTYSPNGLQSKEHHYLTTSHTSLDSIHFQGSHNEIIKGTQLTSTTMIYITALPLAILTPPLNREQPLSSVNHNTPKPPHSRGVKNARRYQPTNESNHEWPSYLAKQNTTQEPALPANGARHLAARFLLRSPSSLDKILP